MKHLPELGEFTELKSQPPSTEGSQVPIEVTLGVARYEMGGWIFPGLIKNNSNQWISASLRVHVYDGGGNELGARNPATGEVLTASALNYYIPPRGMGPFFGMAEDSDIAGAPASYKLTVHKVVVIDQPRQIAVLNGRFTPGENARVSGEVKNVGTKVCSSPTVVAVGYTADDRVFYVEMLQLDVQNLEPGQSAPFDEPLSVLESGKLITHGEILGGCWPE